MSVCQMYVRVAGFIVFDLHSFYGIYVKSYWVTLLNHDPMVWKKWSLYSNTMI